MTSHRPYLLRALSEWIADNDMTPHLLVDATQPGVQVPPSAVKEGKVVLNIAQRAVMREVYAPGAPPGRIACTPVGVQTGKAWPDQTGRSRSFFSCSVRLRTKPGWRKMRLP